MSAASCMGVIAAARRAAGGGGGGGPALLLLDTFSSGSMVTGRAPDTGAGTWVVDDIDSALQITGGSLGNSIPEGSALGGNNASAYDLAGAVTQWRYEVLVPAITDPGLFGISAPPNTFLALGTFGLTLPGGGAVPSIDLGYRNSSGLTGGARVRVVDSSGASTVFTVSTLVGAPLRISMETDVSVTSVNAVVEQFVTGVWTSLMSQVIGLFAPDGVSFQIRPGALVTIGTGLTNPLHVDAVQFNQK